MDMNKNKISKNVKSIHLIAICGTGMGALGSMLKDLGYKVTGSDQQVYPPMSEFLSNKGIKIAEGFNEKNVSYGPDLVVVGNAVSKDNPEVVRMDQMGLEFCSMPQAVNRFVAAGKKQLVITGTHGKTTTSSILAWILYHAGLDPIFMIGGIVKNFNSNYHLGKGEHIIIEGDEYDTAFFDKGPKFLHYDPFMAILTGVEFDHADIFKDINHVRQAFDSFIAGMSPQSTLLACDNDKNVADLICKSQCRVVQYGTNANALWRLGAVSIAPPWTFFEVLKHNAFFGNFKTRLFGEHNLLNSLSAIAIADNLMIPAKAILKHLKVSRGARKCAAKKAALPLWTILPITPRPFGRPSGRSNRFTRKDGLLPYLNPEPIPACAKCFRTSIRFHLTMQISHASVIPRALTRFLLPKGFHPKNWWLTSNTAARMRTTFRTPIRSSTSSYQKPGPVI